MTPTPQRRALTEREHAITEWISRWKFVTASHIQHHFFHGKTSAKTLTYRYLARLKTRGMITANPPTPANHTLYTTTRAAHQLLGTPLPVTRPHPATLIHDAAAVTLATRLHHADPTVKFLTEKELHYHEAHLPPQHLHYCVPHTHDPIRTLIIPDLISVHPTTGIHAHEIDLTSKRQARLIHLFRSYLVAPHHTSVTYYVPERHLRLYHRALAHAHRHIGPLATTHITITTLNHLTP